MTEAPAKKLSGAESIKLNSHYLKGNIAEDLASAGLEVTDETYELLKFHGSYFGYNRDSATERKQQGLEKEYEFMLRLKMPGGRLTAEQYLKLDEICDTFANGSLRITTRQTFQFHCIIKPHMKPFVAEINRMLLSTLGGCGDVVRNILACPAPIKDRLHAKLEEDTYTLARVCAPRTEAYYEIWLDGEKVNYPFAPLPAEPGVVEPLYGTTYMPRKFKIAIADPRDNCTDALTNDLAILSLFNGDGGAEHVGYNFALGGGLGMKHNNVKTYPRLASNIMFVPPELFVPATEAVVKLQRDHGDRGDRQHARLKYVVQEKGIAWVKETLEGYLGREMDDPKPMPAFAVEDHMGWHAQGDGKWFLGVPVPSGRIADFGDEQIRAGLREVIQEYKMPLVLTADQNIILADIEEGEKGAITEKLKRFGIKLTEDMTPMARNMFACVALPTCGKALAEAERVQKPIETGIETVLSKLGLLKEAIAIRIAGCPNGCSRPYVGDIGIVGRMPDHYALFIGGDFEGTRLNEKIFDKVPLDNLPDVLEPMLELWRDKREGSEGFGDFAHRTGVASVKQAAVNALGAKFDWVK